MKFEDKYIVLKSSFPFCDLSADDAAVISDVAFYHEFKPSERIASRGDMPTHVFLVFDGSINSDDVNRGLFGAREILSESEFERDVYADSKTGAKCLVLTREQFLSATRKCPSILVEMAMGESSKNRDCI